MTNSMVILAADEHHPLMPAWPEVIASLLFLGVLVFVISKFVAPRFEKVYAERTQAIEGGIQQAEQMQTEAKEALEQYQQQLSEARHEASRIREEAREQGAAIIAEMRETAQAEASRITTAAQAQIDAERQQVVAQLRGELGDLAVQLSGRIVGESLEDEARQRRVVERFLEEMEQSQQANSVPASGQATEGSR